MHYTYKKLSLFKIVLWLTILWVTVFTINIFSDEVLGMTFLLLGAFLVCWGSSYFVFRILQYAMKQYHIYEYEKMAEAYKLSFLFSCYIIINLILIIIERWTKLIWINLLIAFIIIQILLIYDREPKDD